MIYIYISPILYLIYMYHMCDITYICICVYVWYIYIYICVSMIFLGIYICVYIYI